MPRPHRVQSPIRDLRAIIGKTQREFAHSIGISPIALTRIENGTLALSRRVAHKIVCETALDPRCLNGKLRTLRNRRGDVYTKEFYKAVKEVDPCSEEVIKKRVGLLRGAIEVLLRASVFGYRKQMWHVYAEIAQTLDRCRVDFCLQRPIDEILGERLAWEELLAPWTEWEVEFTARKPRSSSRRRRKA